MKYGVHVALWMAQWPEDIAPHSGLLHTLEARFRAKQQVRAKQQALRWRAAA